MTMAVEIQKYGCAGGRGWVSWNGEG